MLELKLTSGAYCRVGYTWQICIRMLDRRLDQWIRACIQYGATWQ